jgi:hypothetical protein
VNDYSKAVKQILKANGCWFKRQGRGDHEIWFSPITNRAFTVDNRIKSKHTANGTLKDAGLPKAF